MPSLSYRTSMTAGAGEAIHVTVYDQDGVPLDPATDPVDWTDLADTTTVTPDATGYLFESAIIGSDVVTGTWGVATGSFTLTWTNRPLRFSSP